MLGVQGVASHGRFFVVSDGEAGAPRGLGDDGSVMMISGLGQVGQLIDGSGGPLVQEAKRRIESARPTGAPPPSSVPPFPSPNPLTMTVKLFNLELPLWVWLLLAALLGGAGGYYLGRR
jgi:hypothetical protein